MTRHAITDRSAIHLARTPRAFGHAALLTSGLLAGTGAVVGGVGCIPDPPHTFQSLAPNDRLDAIVEASDRTDHDSLVGLVDQLSSDDPAARVLAVAALRKRTGQNFGYEPADPEWRRKPAALKWQEHVESIAQAAPESPGAAGAPDSDSTLVEGGSPGPALPNTVSTTGESGGGDG